jgi:hypothetical protein
MLLCAAARGPGLARILVPAVRGKSSQWIKQWGLNDTQARELLIALANLVKVRWRHVRWLTRGHQS